MNRETRRAYTYGHLKDWDYDLETEFLSGVYAGLPRDIEREAERQSYLELMHEPEEDEYFGVKSWFIANFIRSDMEAVFLEVAADFLAKDPYAKDKNLFRSIILPLRETKGPDSAYIFMVLSMMVECVYAGDKYAAERILDLYKTYYKQEYNYFKRLHVLSTVFFHEMYGNNRDDMDEDEADRVMNIRGARLAVMSFIMKKEMSPDYMPIFFLLNENVYRERMIWNVIVATSFYDDIVDKQTTELESWAEKLTSIYPEMSRPEDYQADSRYDLIADVFSEITLSCEENGFHEQYLFKDDEFDVFPYASRLKTLMDEDQPDLEKILYMSVIRYLAEEYSKLYRSMERNIMTALGVEEDEIVTDEDLIDEGIREEGIVGRHFDNGKQSKDRLSEKIRQKLRDATPDEKKAEKLADRPVERFSRDEQGNDGKSEQNALEGEISCLQGKVKDLQLKLNEQRSLLEESKSREKGLERLLEQREEEHQELLNLREFVKSLKEDSKPGQSVLTENDMIKKLEGVKGVIVGGQENWVKKIRQKLPEWSYMAVRDSVHADQSVAGADVVFFFSDALSHNMYYRVMSTIRKRDIPFHYLHGISIPRNIADIYYSIYPEGENEDA